ncbi:MAG: AMP-binding protein [Cytophagales bacterium]
MPIELKFISTKVETEKNIRTFCHAYKKGFEKYELKTSGSTGLPKSIFFSKIQMQNSALSTIERLKLVEGSIALICLNTNYIAGKMMLVRCIEANMKAVVVEPSAYPFDDLPDKIKIDFAAFVPLQLTKILERNSKKDIEILNQIKTIIVGGEQISNSLLNQLKNLKADVFHTFGMTETISHFALKHISANKAYFELLNGVEIGVNGNNCLKVRSNVTNNIWIQSNDIVQLIFEGNKVAGFEWIGRIDNVINSGGVKINVETVENLVQNVFFNMNFTGNFFVYKKPDPTFTEKVVLFIEGKNLGENFTKELMEMIKNAAENKYWVPKEIMFINTFTFTNSGKIDRIKTSENASS